MDFTVNPVFKFILRTVEFGLEHSAKRWYSTYQGTVAKSIVSNPDPKAATGKSVPGNVDNQFQGRVVVNVPDLGVGEKTEDNEGFISEDLIHSALPISPYAGRDHGFYFPPEVGDSVWVSFEFGNPHAPRYHGGWWSNTGAGSGSNASELPAEFQAKKDSVPRVRGIKTGAGHGLAFSDDPDDLSVYLWTGVAQKTDPGQPTVAATKNQKLLLTDNNSEAGIFARSNYGHGVELNDTTQTITIHGLTGDPEVNAIVIDDNADKNTITVKTRSGHTIIVDDSSESIVVTTAGGHTLSMDDAGQSIQLSTANQHTISMSDVDQSIHVETTGHNVIDMNDLTQTVQVSTLLEQKVLMNDIALTMAVSTPGVLLIGATGGIAMGSGIAPPVPTGPGVAMESGAGAKIINFIGAVTETVAALTQTILGAWQVSAATIQLQSGSIDAGVSGSTQFVTRAELIDWLASHLHTTTLVGAPTGPPFTLSQPPIGTSAASPFITQNFKAS